MTCWVMHFFQLILFRSYFATEYYYRKNKANGYLCNLYTFIQNATFTLQKLRNWNQRKQKLTDSLTESQLLWSKLSVTNTVTCAHSNHTWQYIAPPLSTKQPIISGFQWRHKAGGALLDKAIHKIRNLFFAGKMTLSHPLNVYGA